MYIDFDKYAISKWLIENTSLTFQQIANFTLMNLIDIHLIADDSPRYAGILPINPIFSNILTKDEIKKGEKDPTYNLKSIILENKSKTQIKSKKYVSKTYNKYKPSAILWIIQDEEAKILPDSIISKLIGTTKKMINSIRDKSYRNYKSLIPKSPVLIGLCTINDLKFAITQVRMSLKKKSKKKK